MVIRTAKFGKCRGFLVAELVVAISVLAVAMIPLAYSFSLEQKLVRTHYDQVVAMEIVDGEIELLRAGDWRSWSEGEHIYPVTAASAKNLPAGRFQLTRTPHLVRLEWIPAKRGASRKVRREFTL